MGVRRRVCVRVKPREIFDDPQHPYTIGLMGAIPSVGKREGALATIRGSVPSPEQMPKGCRFAPRCPFVEQRCLDAVPPDKRLGGTHRVACWVAPVEANFNASALGGAAV